MLMPNTRYETEDSRDKERLISPWSSARHADMEMDNRGREVENGQDKNIDRERENNERYTILQHTLIKHKQQQNRERELREQRERDQQDHHQQQQQQQQSSILSFQLSQQQQHQTTNHHISPHSSSQYPSISPHYPHSSLINSDGALDLKDVKDIKGLKELQETDRSSDGDKNSISPPHDKSQFSPPSDGENIFISKVLTPHNYILL